MKAIFISFNQALYDQIIDLMDELGIRGFTCWETVTGRGSSTGEPHYGTHAWPTLNSAILTFVDETVAPLFLDRLKQMDEASQMQGLKAFCWGGVTAPF